MENETTYGVWAVRSGASIFGHAESWCKEDGKPLEFDTREAAEAYAREMNQKTTVNVHYYAQEKEPEPGAVRKTSAQAQPDMDARARQTDYAGAGPVGGDSFRSTQQLRRHGGYVGRG